MADGIIKNIYSTLNKVFGNSKPQEFATRQSIEQALAASSRPSATPPIIDPNIIANKGVPLGVFIDKGNGLTYHSYMERERARQNRYAIFDKMDTDIIASALDVYANEATQKNQDGTIVAVHSQSKYIQDELSDMLANIGINNHKSWGIIRDMCKYGDRFESIKIDSNKGVVKLSTLEPRSIYRIEKDGEHFGYVQDLDALKKEYAAYMGSNTSMQSPYLDLAGILQPYLSRNVFSVADNDRENVEAFTKYELMHFKLRAYSSQDSYGKSLLESAVDVWKKLDLVLDSIIIYRLNRAPSRLVFYVDVGNNQGAEIENIIMQQINKVNKREFMDPSGKVNARYNLLDMNANIFIPVGKNAQNSRIEKLAGESSLGDIEDMAYLNNRLFSALKVPKSFLGFGEGDVTGKGMLAQQNVSFGKALQNIQEDFLECVKDLCIIHLAVKGISSERELKSFDLVMSRPSYIEEKARIELESELLNLASNYKGFNVNSKWIAKNILHRTDPEIEEMFKPDPMAQQEGGGLGGGLGDLGGGLGGDIGGIGLSGSGNVDQTQIQPSPDNSQIPTESSVQMAGAQAGAGGETPLMQGRVVQGLVFFEQNTSTVCTKISCKKPHIDMKQYITLVEDSKTLRNFNN